MVVVGNAVVLCYVTRQEWTYATLRRAKNNLKKRFVMYSGGGGGGNGDSWVMNPNVKSRRKKIPFRIVLQNGSLREEKNISGRVGASGSVQQVLLESAPFGGLEHVSKKLLPQQSSVTELGNLGKP